MHSIIDGSAASTDNAVKKSDQKTTNDLKGKRKDLSFTLRNMIENEQKNVVQMYKELKKKQRMESAAGDK